MHSVDLRTQCSLVVMMASISVSKGFAWELAGVETSEVLEKPAPLFSADGVSPSEANGSLDGFLINTGDVVSMLRPGLSVFSVMLDAMVVGWARSQIARLSMAVDG